MVLMFPINRKVREIAKDANDEGELLKAYSKDDTLLLIYLKESIQRKLLDMFS